jgi:hypothetical protein
MSEKEIKDSKKVRNSKDRERYLNNEKSRELKQYTNRKSTARNFLLKYIKEEDKEEFINILKKLLKNY